MREWEKERRFMTMVVNDILKKEFVFFSTCKLLKNGYLKCRSFRETADKDYVDCQQNLIGYSKKRACLLFIMYFFYFRKIRSLLLRSKSDF